MDLPMELKLLIAKLLDISGLAKLLSVSTEYCVIAKEVIRKRKDACLKTNIVWALYCNMVYCPYDLNLYKTSDEALEYVYDRCVESQIYDIDEDGENISITDYLTDSFGKLYDIPTFNREKTRLNLGYSPDSSFFPDGNFGLTPLFGYDIKKTFYVIQGGNGHFRELTQNSNRAKELEKKYVVRKYDFN